jgi:hypothetical protein
MSSCGQESDLQFRRAAERNGANPEQRLKQRGIETDGQGNKREPAKNPADVERSAGDSFARAEKVGTKQQTAAFGTTHGGSVSEQDIASYRAGTGFNKGFRKRLSGFTVRSAAFDSL